MQRDRDLVTQNGAFRLAYASSEDLLHNFYSWKYYEFTSSDFNLGGVGFDLHTWQHPIPIYMLL